MQQAAENDAQTRENAKSSKATKVAKAAATLLVCVQYQLYSLSFEQLRQFSREKDVKALCSALFVKEPLKEVIPDHFGADSSSVDLLGMMGAAYLGHAYGGMVYDEMRDTKATYHNYLTSARMDTSAMKTSGLFEMANYKKPLAPIEKINQILNARGLTYMELWREARHNKGLEQLLKAAEVNQVEKSIIKASGERDLNNLKQDQKDENGKKFFPLKLQKVPEKVIVEVNGRERELAVYAAIKFYKEQIKPRRNKIMELIYEIARRRTVEMAKRGDFPHYYYDPIKDRNDGIVPKYNEDGTLNKEFQTILNDPKKRRRYGGLLYTISWIELDKNGNPKLDNEGNYIFKKVKDDKNQNKDIRYLGVTYSMSIRQYRRIRSTLIKNSEKLQYFKVKKNIKNSLIRAWIEVQERYPEFNMKDMAIRYGITGESNPMNWNQELFDEIFREDGLMSRFIEIGFLFEIIEFHKWYENSFIYEKKRIDENFYQTEGSNVKRGSGGGRKSIYRLPYYDIILLTSLGSSSIEKKISELYEISERKITLSINDPKEGFGGLSKLQEEFLKPILEELYKEGISGREISKTFEELVGPARTSRGRLWFHNWLIGIEGIEINGRQEYRYYGETVAFWADFFYEQVSRGLSANDAAKELSKELGTKKRVAKNMRTTILNKLGYRAWTNLVRAHQILEYIKGLKRESILHKVKFTLHSVSEALSYKEIYLKQYFALFEEQGLIYRKGGYYYKSGIL
jgi:hypothetical protein